MDTVKDMPKAGITVKGEAKREKILRKALHLFNKYGVERIGTREVARALKMRAGHVTYYFPDKDSLVLALGLELRALNDGVQLDATVASVDELIVRFEQVMRNHIAYRGLVLSMARILSALAQTRAEYQSIQEGRLLGIRACLQGLVANGLLVPLTRVQQEFLVSCISLISRGWMVESLAGGYDLEERIPHYLGLIRGLLWTYSMPSSG
ncbi:MAG: TetR/AcrR family transcriptional regulator [Flavobacteriales bacterium]|nr:TetR/AcrR family transcriptional regulator [Flavobacteriales bacterium]